MMSTSIDPWHTVNDNVMDGLSYGSIALGSQDLHFRRELSIQNK